MRRLILFLMIGLLSFIPVYAQDTAPTIAKLVQTRPELSQLFDALNHADPVVLDTLDDPEADLTLFAPTDSAFDALADALPQANSIEHTILGKESLDAVLDDQKLLTEVLRYHMVKGALPWDDLLAMLDESGGWSFLPALNGDIDNLSATYASTGKIVMDEGIHVNVEFQIDLKVKGIEASNGIIYLIDGVLLPETRTIAGILAENAADKDYPEYTILTKILEAADPAILQLLGKPDADVTLFTPLDAAFSDFSEAQLASLTGDKEQATAFLNHYIAPGLIYGFQIPHLLSADGTLDIEMADGSTAALSLPEEHYNGEFNFDDILISYPDTVAQNGLMQEFETPISPT